MSVREAPASPEAASDVSFRSPTASIMPQVLRRRAAWSTLAPLFLVSLATVGFEIALTRYFAVAKWSEYGDWVISIVLAGFAFSGVAMALARDVFVRHGKLLLSALPVALIIAAASGFHLVTLNPFNPLQLQNPATFAGQLWNIAGYYAALLPFFFLSGLYISLCFVLNDEDVGRVYGFDLTGAGTGALAVLGLMALVHPFRLVPCLLVPFALAAVFAPVRRGRAVALAVLALAGGEALLLLDGRAEINDFKAIYAPLHVPDSRVAEQLASPRGLFMLLDDFTERVDTDISNNAGLLGQPGPPQSFGLFRDGNRVAALPKGQPDAGYAAATLGALPYVLRPHARVLLAGASGGFRIAEARALGAAEVLVLEPEPVLLGALRDGFGPSPPYATPNGVRLSRAGPIAATRTGGAWDVIDLSSDFLDASEANASAFAAEAIALYLRALAPGGIVSIPVSIREFPAYAVRMLATVREGLRIAGIADAPAHVLVIRSAWNVRILVSNTPFSADRISAAKQFCDERSFDVSFFPGIDVAAARANIYNDLPAVSFEAGEVTSGDGLNDAIADEALAVLQGRPTESGAAFDLSPITFDRPSFYAVLRLSRLGTILQRIEILPQAELGPLVNLAVLSQAVVVALIVLAVPLLGGRRFRAGRPGALRAAAYFAALGLGFLAIEIALIERASFYLNDRTTGFSLVLTGMLVFSGLGAMLAGRFEGHERRGAMLAGLVVVAWCGLLLVGLQPFLLATLDLPFAARAAILLLLLAPASVALGLPFPLGLSRMGHAGFLPWAWGLNGAFSVVATPLANLIAIKAGYDRVMLMALLLYVVAIVSFPPTRKSLQWPDTRSA